jgi:hypothetical protein
MTEAKCRTCWFYRPVGYISAGLSPKPVEVETCGLENEPLKDVMKNCKSWMSNSGTMINVDISDEAKAEAKKAGKKRWEKEKK